MSAIQAQPIIFEGIDITATINFTSIYIPNLPEDLMLDGYKVSTEESLKYFFENQYHLGKVKRVDIATRPIHGGAHARCAFVHFIEWNPYTQMMRMSLAAGKEHKLYGPTPYSSFYSSANSAFKRFITIKMNRTPITEVSALEAEKMNIHQLVDNYKRMENTLAEKDAKIAELERYIKDLQNICDYNVQKVQNLEFELMASRIESGDLGDEPTDSGPMTLDELSIVSDDSTF